MSDKETKYPEKLTIKRRAPGSFGSMKKNWEKIECKARLTSNRIYVLLDDQELAFTRKIGKPTETNTMTQWRIVTKDLERLKPSLKAEELVTIYYVDSARYLNPSFRIRVAEAKKTKSRYYWVGEGRTSFPGRWAAWIDIHEAYVAESLQGLIGSIEEVLKAQGEALERDYKHETQKVSDTLAVLQEYEKGKREPEAYIELKPSRPGEIEV